MNANSSNQERNEGAAGMNRRSFLRIVGGGVGVPLLLSACAPTNPGGAVSSKPTGAAGGATSVAVAPTSPGKLKLPTYVGVQGVKADLPANQAGLQAGYFTYPTSLVKAITQPPGSGSDITAFTQTTTSVPPPVDENPAWQAINRELNANMKVNVTSSADYLAKAATIMAGGDLPDLFCINNKLNSAGIPGFLKSAYADLTPYLSGDAVKAYPYLAALPTSTWAQTIYNGVISAVPVVRPPWNYVWYVNQTRLDAIGAAQPRNADDFRRILKELTRPQQNQYGIGAGAPAYGWVNSARGDSPQTAMFGAPNNWSVDASGKFTKDFETEQFKVALGYVRDLYADGVFWPEPTTLNSVQLKTNFLNGNIAVISTGWNSYQVEFWDVGLRATPPVKVRTFHPFSSDGSQPIWHQFQGLNGMTAVKKGSAERVQELLRVLNYLAAPFGSQEYQLINFGVKDTDFDFDAKGNPVLTQKGKAETGVGWQFLATAMPILFNPNDVEFAKVAYADQQAMLPYLLPDPSAGLYSPTDLGKGGQLTQAFSDGLRDLITGASPMSNLDQLLKDWRAAGGDQMRREFEQAYADSK